MAKRQKLRTYRVEGNVQAVGQGTFLYDTQSGGVYRVHDSMMVPASNGNESHLLVRARYAGTPFDIKAKGSQLLGVKLHQAG